MKASNLDRGEVFFFLFIFVALTALVAVLGSPDHTLFQPTTIEIDSK